MHTQTSTHLIERKPVTHSRPGLHRHPEHQGRLARARPRRRRRHCLRSALRPVPCSRKSRTSIAQNAGRGHVHDRLRPRQRCHRVLECESQYRRGRRENALACRRRRDAAGAPGREPVHPRLERREPKREDVRPVPHVRRQARLWNTYNGRRRRATTTTRVDGQPLVRPQTGASVPCSTTAHVQITAHSSHASKSMRRSVCSGGSSGGSIHALKRSTTPVAVQAPPPPPSIKRAALELFVRREVRPRVELICAGGLEGSRHQKLCLAVAQSLGKWQPIAGAGIVAPFCERICWHSCQGEAHIGGVRDCAIRTKNTIPLPQYTPRLHLLRRPTTASWSARPRAALTTRASTFCSGAFIRTTSLSLYTAPSLTILVQGVSTRGRSRDPEPLRHDMLTRAAQPTQPSRAATASTASICRSQPAASRAATSSSLPRNSLS